MTPLFTTGIVRVPAFDRGLITREAVPQPRGTGPCQADAPLTAERVFVPAPYTQYASEMPAYHHRAMPGTFLVREIIGHSPKNAKSIAGVKPKLWITKSAIWQLDKIVAKAGVFTIRRPFGKAGHAASDTQREASAPKKNLRVVADYMVCNPLTRHPRTRGHRDAVGDCAMRLMRGRDLSIICLRAPAFGRDMVCQLRSSIPDDTVVVQNDDAAFFKHQRASCDGFGGGCVFPPGDCFDFSNSGDVGGLDRAYFHVKLPFRDALKESRNRVAWMPSAPCLATAFEMVVC